MEILGNRGDFSEGPRGGQFLSMMQRKEFFIHMVQLLRQYSNQQFRLAHKISDVTKHSYESLEHPSTSLFI